MEPVAQPGFFEGGSSEKLVTTVLGHLCPVLSRHRAGKVAESRQEAAQILDGRFEPLMINAKESEYPLATLLDGNLPPQESCVKFYFE